MKAEIKKLLTERGFHEEDYDEERTKWLEKNVRNELFNIFISVGSYYIDVIVFDYELDKLQWSEKLETNMENLQKVLKAYDNEYMDNR